MAGTGSSEGLVATLQLASACCAGDVVGRPAVAKYRGAVAAAGKVARKPRARPVRWPPPQVFLSRAVRICRRSATHYLVSYSRLVPSGLAFGRNATLPSGPLPCEMRNLGPCIFLWETRCSLSTKG
jgi:hypothetical protein